MSTARTQPGAQAAPQSVPLGAPDDGPAAAATTGATTAATAAATAATGRATTIPATPPWPTVPLETPALAVPPLRRRREGRVLGGVAGGVADHLHLEPLHVRVAFALLTALALFGVVLYAALWVFVPLARPGEGQPAGLAAATRAGTRGGVRLGRSAVDAGQVCALAALAVGLVLLLSRTSLGIPVGVVVPVLLAAAGVGVLLSLGDEDDRRDATPPTSERTDSPRRRLGNVLRVLAGAALVGAGVVAFLAARGDVAAPIGDLAVATVVVLLGVLVVAGPFLYRLARERDAERRERIVNQERADVAAHLHDSVLQTLALIRRQADDPRAVVGLARAQERELRQWLYGAPPAAATTLVTSLSEVAGEVEAAYGVPVELVTVGDAVLDGAGGTEHEERLRAIVAATREATANAARHSGADLVDVYAEVGPDGVEVYVRDRGRGFDPAAVPADRLGLRGSVLGRVERHAGRADVRSVPGEGTEVRLHVPLTRQPSSGRQDDTGEQRAAGAPAEQSVTGHEAAAEVEQR